MLPAAKKINSHNLEGQGWPLDNGISRAVQGWQTPCQGVCLLHGPPCEQGLLPWV